MTKKSREGLTIIGEVKTKSGSDSFKVKVLADLFQIIATQGLLATQSNFGHNRQVYGPFKVTVSVDKDQPKQKRAKKKKQ